MNRLQSELHRLYSPLSPTGHETGARAMVMELAAPPSWAILSRVWHGVQAELELPAPAIAVSGIDGIQLWFSLAEEVATSRAEAFLGLLRSKFMPDVDARRVRLKLATQAPPVPALQEATGNWSAFIAPDLAPVFAETPWLDSAPNEEGQAALLRGLVSMTTEAFEAACEQLSATASSQVPGGVSPAETAEPAATSTREAQPGTKLAERGLAAGDPKRFLLQVMDDETAPLAIRVEAAKALLLHEAAIALPRNSPSQA